MEPSAATSPVRPGPSRAAVTTGAVALGIVSVLCVTWAKWDPYGRKLAGLLHTRLWSGSSILASAGEAGAAPSWHSAWSFAVAYGKSVWIALVAALLISASLDALAPRERVAGFLTRRSPARSTAVAGLLAIPCMMCTCCSAPLAATLRRRGVPTHSVLGYWLGNPVLNPAVLAFLAIVAPWQWVVTRLAVGAVLVFGGSVLVARLAGGRAERGGAAAGAASGPAAGALGADGGEPFSLRLAPSRFARSLGRLAVTLVPEYFAVVLLLGAFRGWLFPLGASAAHWGLLAVLLAAVAGTLIVIPTAGEIPILQGLAALGFGLMPIGTLLITLPAVSLPSMVMLGRALTWRVVAAMAAAVALAGLAGGALLWALG